jgi:hypothetical protein
MTSTRTATESVHPDQVTEPSPPDEQRTAEVDAIVEAILRARLRAAAELAVVAIEETGFGVFEDKVVKDYVATEFLHD